MAHHIYQTEGFVCGSKNIGEANRLLFLFTKDLGMISATAQGIRLLKSKLRFSLQDFSYCSLALVRGKHSWKITSARELSPLPMRLRENEEKHLLAARIFLLLRRLIPGEEKNEKLYSLLQSGLAQLAGIPENAEALKNFECLFVLRVLHTLGYFSEREPLRQFVVCPDFQNAEEWNEAMLGSLGMHRKEAVSAINASLSESQL